MENQLANAQAMRYAVELRDLHAVERMQRADLLQALQDVRQSYDTTVRALATTLELRDDMTGGHAERVTALALRLAERVAPELHQNPQLEYGFLLHDLGKIGVPDRILLKNGPLSAEDRRVIELHPLQGDRIIAQIPYLAGLAREVVVSHHERWDGSGYPHSLIGCGIPLGARIFGVVDAFDAMTNDRPYRKAQPLSVAIEEIERGAGTQFDPSIAAIFLSLAAESETEAA